MRTQNAFYADDPHTGGWLFGNISVLQTFSANLVATRNALGDYSLNRTAAGAETYNVVCSIFDMKRLPENLGNALLGGSTTVAQWSPYQEQFGTSTVVQGGQAGNPVGGSGAPPFTGNSQFTVSTTSPSKGLRITDVFVVYQVGVVSLTSAALSLNRTAFADVTAINITNMPISATALTLTANANPRVAVRAVTAPAFEITDLSDVTVDFQFVMANTGTMRVYGLGVHVDFNYN